MKEFKKGNFLLENLIKKLKIENKQSQLLCEKQILGGKMVNKNKKDLTMKCLRTKMVILRVE